MRRMITGFHHDDDGDWVAELSCLHRQHIRHRPPFWNAEWIEDDEKRAAHVGEWLDCPLCDRGEMPDDLRLARTTPIWDQSTAPPALRHAHRVGAGTWGLLTVEAGRLRFVAETTPRLNVVVDEGRSQPIPPEVPHHVELLDGVRFRIEFYIR